MATRVAVLIPFLRHGTRPFLWLLRGFLSWEIMCHKVSHFSSRAKQQENLNIKGSFRCCSRMFDRLENAGGWDGGTPWHRFHRKDVPMPAPSEHRTSWPHSPVRISPLEMFGRNSGTATWLTQHVCSLQ